MHYQCFKKHIDLVHDTDRRHVLHRHQRQQTNDILEQSVEPEPSTQTMTPLKLLLGTLLKFEDILDLVLVINLILL